jgi:Neurotransmitter-gated ion-channel ligand binding domain
MHLALFPFDEQTCHLNVASYGWTKDDLIYSWKDAGAVQFPENFSLPGGFKLADTGMEYCDVQTATGDYSCLRVRSKNCMLTATNKSDIHGGITVV